VKITPICFAENRVQRSDRMEYFSVPDDESENGVSKSQQKQPNGRAGGAAFTDTNTPEQNRIALLGLPTLSDVYQMQIRIRESKEFKVSSHIFKTPAFL